MKLPDHLGFWGKRAREREEEMWSNKMSKEMMGILSNKVSKETLNPGDHIYTWRNAYLYSHHDLFTSSLL
ncbi:hypothetical protein CsSME_00006126 [Camellia sinensis var. sinensis]